MRGYTRMKMINGERFPPYYSKRRNPSYIRDACISSIFLSVSKEKCQTGNEIQEKVTLKSSVVANCFLYGCCIREIKIRLQKLKILVNSHHPFVFRLLMVFG